MTSDFTMILAVGRALILEGLESLIQKHCQLKLLHSSESGSETIGKCMLHKPDIAVISVRLKDLNGLSVARKVKEYLPETKIIILSAQFNEAYLLEAFELGADAYLSFELSFSYFTETLSKIQSGHQSFLGKNGTFLTMTNHPTKAQRDTRIKIMTRREKELALLLADGYTLKEAATILYISPKTADIHRSSLMKKLQAKNVTDIVKYCIRNQLIEA